MSAITLVRDAIEPGGRNVFSCTEREWELLVQLGQSFGWSGRGATYVRHVGASANDEARHGYRAGEPRDPKRIDSEDAMNWAAALDGARRTQRIDAMLEATTRTDQQGPIDPMQFAAILDDFIEYAYGGEFTFSQA